MEKYDNQADFVFKKCISKETGHACLVIGKKPQYFVYDKNGKRQSFNFLCNESRQNIGNKNFAKFRCNGLIIVEIYDLVTNKTLPFITHTCVLSFWSIFMPNRLVSIEYIKGEFIQPDEYDLNIEGICRPGLHYFLSREAALNYEYGYSKGYDANGHLILQRDETNHVNFLTQSPAQNVIVSKINWWMRSNNQRTGGQKMVLASKFKKQKDSIKLPKKSCVIRHIQPLSRRFIK